MNKRKLSGDGSCGFGGPARRPNIGNIRARGTNAIQRKPGAMNVRPNANRRLMTSTSDIKRLNHTRMNDADSNDPVKEDKTPVPKTRFTAEHQSSNVQTSFTPRLKAFPTETIRRVENSPRFSPGSSMTCNAQECQRNTSPDHMNSSSANNGFGDSPSACNEIKVLQSHAPTENKAQVSSMSQQHMPTSQQINKVNQSEVILSSPCPVAEKQAHRPFVPNLSHGMAVRDSSPQKAALSPPLPTERASANNNQQQQHLIVVPQQLTPLASLAQQHQQQPQIQQRISAASQPQQTPLRQQGNPAWISDETLLPGYEKQPIGGRNNAAHRRSQTQEKKQNYMVQPERTRLPEYSDYIPSSLPVMQLNLSPRYTADMPQRQNPQQIFQQMQNNTVRQQNMQQRALSHQQQMAAAQQHMTRIPLAQQLQMSAQQMQMNQTPCDGAAQQMSRREFGITGSGMSSPQDVNVNQIRTPQNALYHQQMFVHQQNAGCPITSQNGWVRNNQVIGEHPSVKTQLKAFAVDLVDSNGRGVPKSGTAQYQKLKQNEAQLMSSQQTARQQAAMQWQPQMWQQQYQSFSPQNSVGVPPRNQPMSQQNGASEQNGMYRHVQMPQPNITTQHHQQYQASTLQQQQKTFAVDSAGSDRRDVPQFGTAQYQKLNQNEAQLMSSQQTAMQWQPQMQHRQYQGMSPQNSVRVAEQNGMYRYVQVPQQQRQVSTLQQQQSQLQPETQLIMKQQEQQEKVPAQLAQSVTKKSLNFTPEMIRDQELLVSNMRQQRIPEDTMERHFNALLNEQRKYLIYTNQLETFGERAEARVQRRVSRIQGDQRPDWMGRITPARMSYRDIERLQENRLVQKQNEENDKQVNRYNGTQRTVARQNTPSSTQRQVQQLQTQRNAGSVQLQQGSSSQPLQMQRSMPQQNVGSAQLQQEPPPQQLHVQGQQDAYQLWQQQTANWQQRIGVPPPPYKYPTQQYHQTQSGWAQSPYLQDHQRQTHKQQVQHQQQQQPMYSKAQQPQSTSFQKPQHQQNVQEEVQQQPSAFSCNYDDMKEAFQQFRQTVRNDEPSSLLKMREYKKIIRPQKQNNGLQDPQTVLEALEALKNSENKKGLEYIARLHEKEPSLKLNGTQDPSEMVNIPGPPVERIPQPTFKVSSNGLENSRNANNPAVRPFSFPIKPEERIPFGYPHHRQTKLQQCTRSLVPEQEYGSVAEYLNPQQDKVLRTSRQPVQRYGTTNANIEQQLSSQHFSQAQEVPIQVQGKYPPAGASQVQQNAPYNGRNPMTTRNLTVMPYKFVAVQPQYYDQMQQYYRNQQNFGNKGEGDESLPKGTTVQEKMNVSQSPEAGGDAMRLLNQTPQKPLEKVAQSQQQNGTAMMPAQTYSPQGSAQIAQNKQAVAQYLQMQQATTTVNNYGQPELRQPKSIGGLTYLARKPDYNSSSPLIAPDRLIATKFLQPAPTFV